MYEAFEDLIVTTGELKAENIGVVNLSHLNTIHDTINTIHANGNG